MEGKKFSASRGVAIYVRDVLERYDPDPVRYFLTAAGPETQDTDFTWSEFVRRNNDELLANWGNLVNRTLTNAYRNFGAVPEPGELTDADRAVLDGVAAALRVGRRADRAVPLQGGARRGDARLVAREPVRLRSGAVGDDQGAIATARRRSCTSRFAASTASRCCSRRSCRLRRQMLHELLGYDGVPRRPARVSGGDGGRRPTHTILTGDYASWVGAWSPSELPPGQKLREPRPLFRKLDPRGSRARADE